MNIRAIQFIGLNGVRALSLVSLILVFSSTILVMVTNIKAVNAFVANGGVNEDNSTMIDCDYIEGSTVPNQPAGVFWAVVASLLILFQVIVLFLSELSWPMAFFDRFFPVLGSKFGLGALGIFQCLIATQVLSHHVDDFTLVSGFFLFSIGCLNILLGLIFRQHAKSKRSITSWRADAKSVLPTTAERPVFTIAHAGPSSIYSTEKPPMMQTMSRQGSSASTDRSGYGFGRQGEKHAGLRGFILQKPEESLPRYVPPASTHSRRTSVSSDLSYVSNAPGHHEERETPSRTGTPVFKSSPSAL